MSRVVQKKDPILFSLFPEARGWVYFETNDDNIPIEELIEHRGKWVIYGSKQYVENLANVLKEKIGKEIDALKYSVDPTKVTPNAPEGNYALLVYCHESKRNRVLTMLKSIGVEEATWKYDRESLLELVNDPLFCLKLELLNPGRLEYLAGLLQIDPAILKEVKDFRNYVIRLSERIRELSKKRKIGNGQRLSLILRG
jgi:hypothetical protein